ncbi:hypothetical protein [Paenibacillus alkalitolerans]|uniref:hypothetical protein n=1 Tax=Paenibacillus alkalitolerans TaxID=2799335 RepID=UPI0018F321EB|nr:hypothetical protein [Paenibacillus alkalitolerans]
MLQDAPSLHPGGNIPQNLFQIPYAPPDYRFNVRKETLYMRDIIFNKRGFLDGYGYIVDYRNKLPTSLGEATLFTAIAAVALATGNYSQDTWESINANKKLKALLWTLKEQSWGNEDVGFKKHPIRHPLKQEFSKNHDFLRVSPLTKDSFGAIVAACYYSYICPNSDDEVRTIARDLIKKWGDYLNDPQSQWRTHYNYIPGEFEFDTIGGKKYYKHIFEEDGGRVMFKGPESFQLLPHEIIALQNVAETMGIWTNRWNIWLRGMLPDLKKTIYDIAAPYFAEFAANGLEYVLEKLVFEYPYSIQLGPDNWKQGKVEGVFKVGVPANQRRAVVDRFKMLVIKYIRHSVLLDDYRTSQAVYFLEQMIEKVLGSFAILQRDKWRSILNLAMRRVLPWLDGSIWVEAVTFLGTQQLLKATGESEISYTVWSFAVECETRFELRPLLNPSVQEFFQYLKFVGNPNGLWAWLSDDVFTLRQQLTRFETHDTWHWWEFAYGPTKYNDWVDKPDRESPDGRESSRLDYLVLDGLAEKGSPLRPTTIIIPDDWLHMFMRSARDALLEFLKGIKDDFRDLGIYARKTVNHAGETLREIWNDSLEYTSELFRFKQLVSKAVLDRAGKFLYKFNILPNGQMVVEHWNKIEKYWKGVWSDATGTADKMIERFKISFGDITTQEFWNTEFQEYWKRVWSDSSMARDKLMQVMEIGWDQKLLQEYYNRGNYKYWKGVWSNKIGTADKMIERINVSLDDLTYKEWWSPAPGIKYHLNVTSAGNPLKNYLEYIGGKKELEIWDEAGNWGKSVFNAANELISSVGSIPPLNVPSWWPPKKHLPF